MIGKKIKIESFMNLDEVKEYLDLYNNLEYRSSHDHTDVNSGSSIIQMFKLNKLQSDDFSMFRIVNQKNDFVGIITFKRVEHYDFLIGYRILKPNYKRQGYMTETLTMFIRYLFTKYPTLRRWTLKIASDNIESIGLAKKVGFKHEGTLREGYEYRQKICDFMIFSILRNEITY